MPQEKRIFGGRFDEADVREFGLAEETGLDTYVSPIEETMNSGAMLLTHL
jgi:hypothetical protein